MFNKLAIGLVFCSMGVHASPANMTDVMEYANRTARDYCGPHNQECINDFSNQVIFAYKDGQMDAKSRFREQTLSKRYEKKLQLLECVPSDTKDKDVCQSVVDRLVDSYNRGLNSK